MSNVTMRLLLTEDDPRLSELLVVGLGRHGWAVDAVSTAEEARSALATVSYRALILDLGLPDGDGLDLLHSVRREDRRLPVLILTARGRLSERVAGLNAGADDYLVKPFALEEMAARIGAACRRADVPVQTELVFGPMVLVPAARTFSVSGVVHALPRREMMVLELLMRARHRFVPKPSLEMALSSFGQEVGANAIEVYVYRLRRRLAAFGAGVKIEVERGLGYRLSEAGASC